MSTDNVIAIPRFRDRPSAPLDAAQRTAALAAWTPSGGGVESRLRVRPVQGGWSVDADAIESLLFTRGTDAERYARTLGKAYAQLGDDVRISVYDARNRLVGAIQYFALEPSPRRDHLARYPWS